MSRRLLPVGVLMVLMSAGLSVLSASADEKQTAKESATESVPSPKRPQIRDVIIMGNSRMSTEQIKSRLRTQPGKEYDPAAVDEDVRDLYKTRQFSNIRTLLDPDGPSKVRVYFLFCDMPNRVQKITFLGAKHIKSEDLRKEIGIRIGTPLNPKLNQESCQKIVEKYEEMGRPFATCRLVKGGKTDDTEVVYQIVEGVKIEEGKPLPATLSPDKKAEKRSPARVGQVFIIGNTLTRDNVILRQVPLFPGGILTYPDLQKAEKNLTESGLFVVDPATGVHPTITVVDYEGNGVYKDIVIAVEEKKAKGAGDNSK